MDLSQRSNRIGPNLIEGGGGDIMGNPREGTRTKLLQKKTRVSYPTEWNISINNGNISHRRFWDRRERKHNIRGTLKHCMKRFQGHIKSPQPAVKLSQSQWEKLKDHSLVVELTDVIKGDKCLSPIWKLKEGERGKLWGMEIDDKDGGFIVPSDLGAIVTDATTLEELYRRKLPKRSIPNIKFLGGGATTVDDSTMVLLAIWRRQKNKQVVKAKTPYTQDDIRWMTKHKYNILKSTKNQHHGSRGLYFGFGIRKSTSSLDDAIHFSSLDEYYLKKGASPYDVEVNQQRRTQLYTNLDVSKANIEAAFYGSTGPSVVVSGTLLSSAMVEGLCCSNPNLKERHRPLGSSGFPSGFVCINAYTEIIHTEPDHTYTMIYCPPQEGLRYNDPSGTTFNFYLDGVDDDDNDCTKENKLKVTIPLNIGTSIFFSAFFLSHRQERHSNIPLLNLGAYGNQKVHQFSRCTLNRNLNHRREHRLRKWILTFCEPCK
jgi:hypothetical protein